MDKLEFEEILEGLRNGNIKSSDIIEALESQQLTYLYDDELEEIALSFDSDDDKMAILKYVFSPIKIITSLKNEENMVKAIGGLWDDDQKAKVALRGLTTDENRLKAISEIKDQKKSLPIKLLLSREGFKKYFLTENNKYDKIGLDENITIGVEIESIGNNSQKILEAGKSNGIVIHEEKKLECGKIIKRRR